MTKVGGEDNMLPFSTEQILGDKVVGFYVRRCAELPFPPFKLDISLDFNVIQMLGRGTEGNVSRCTSKFSEFVCAIKKVVPADLLMEPNHREPRETKVMVELNHPNVVKIYLSWNGTGKDYFGRPTDITFTSMRLSARTLSTYIKRRSTVDMVTVNRLFRELMLGLEHIHEHNVVHHDIKPDNLLLDDDMTLVIADFGIASVKESATSKLNPANVGSFPYVAPEVNSDQNKKHDEKADTFAAAVTYFQMCTRYLGEIKAKELSRRITKAISSWQTWEEFNFDQVFQGTDLLQGWSGSIPLLKMMLHPDDEKRPSATEILAILSANNMAEAGHN